MKSPFSVLANLFGGRRADSRLRNLSPVPQVGMSAASELMWGLRGDMASYLEAMGRVGTLFATVDRNATAVSAVEWDLWRSAASGNPDDRVKVTRHAAVDLWRKPNPFMPRGEFVEASQQHHELVGEIWWVIARNPRFTLPLEMWPVRPDRMAPVPHPEKYLSGYVYRSPDGQRIPLDLNEVIFIRRPNPADPYRGIGAVQTVLAELEGVNLSAQWNRNFFMNDASPGGIIELEDELDDDEFKQFRMRWDEQHRGVSRAHRVAMLEKGKWVDRKYTMRDMEYSKLRDMSRDVIREANAMPKFMLGLVDDVNRATGEASEAQFARWSTVPRLDRIKQALNHDFLPLYGQTATGLEWDYRNPVPEDREAKNAELTSQVGAAKILIDAGFDRQDVLKRLGLPDIALAVTAPVEQPPPAPAEPPVDKVASDWQQWLNRLSPPPDWPPAWAKEPDLEELPAGVDMGAVQREWETALAQLLADWSDVTGQQYDDVIRQIRTAVELGDVTALSSVTAPDAGGPALLTDAMVALALVSAEQVVAEAEAQDVPDVAAVVPAAAALAAIAGVAAGVLAAGVVMSAVREALRVWRPGATADEVTGAVRTHLDSLTDAQPRSQLGGALTGAQNLGRVETMRAAPEAAYYGSEVNDKSTCQPCKDIDGKWLGNSIDDVLNEYPFGGYLRCKGRERCRGNPVAVWRGGADQSKWIEKEAVTT